MGWRGWAIVLAMAGCGDNAIAVDAQTSDTTAPDARTCLPRATYPLTIAAGAFPPTADHPNVVVYAPHNFDPALPLELVVYLHGFNNCAENVIGDSAGLCTASGSPRPAAALASQLDSSARNALLVVPQLGFDTSSSNPGALGVADGFRALLAETLSALPSPLGPLDLAARRRVIVASHSGGYTAAAAIASAGGIAIDELWLLDSLYGQTAQFDGWVMADIASFSSPPDRRFANVYTAGAGTRTNSEAMATRAASWVAADPSALVDDRTTMPIADADLGRGLVFKLSELSHDDVPRTYFARLLSTSPLARTCN
ncbi:MAG TPA: hypothetical protein VIV11_29970 [Kofleriaceae bacterium]